ncbi:DUF6059 family protein [Kitasatospora sp. NPDC018058]|uniref:DUF6059 family protein n=1 Tax=Kitasatospora sp. NPDC018058 TaxID=3364025 RepID=UPI0037BF5D25
MTVISPSKPHGAAGRQLAPVRILAVRLIHGIYQALCTSGWILIGPMPPAEEVHVLDAPPSGHPERLCADRPLSPVERALERQLTD